MRSSVAKLLKRQLAYKLQKANVPFNKRAYRTLKDLWNERPRPMRQYFFN